MTFSSCRMNPSAGFPVMRCAALVSLAAMASPALRAALPAMNVTRLE